MCSTTELTARKLEVGSAFMRTHRGANLLAPGPANASSILNPNGFAATGDLRLTDHPACPGIPLSLINHMKKFKVGMIGYGWAAGAHIDAINATTNAEVTAVFSSRPLDDADLSAKHGRPMKSFTSLEAMLADPSIHVVDISSYPSAHKDQALAVAKAGKHLIIEKPMAMTLEDCRSIVDAAAAAGVKGCVCFECRFSGQFQATKAIVDEGLLGSIHYGEVDYYHGIGPWYGQYRWNIFKKDGGSALLTAGCHALDALLMIMNGQVESVTSFSTKSKSAIFAPYEYDTSSVTLLHFKDGRVGKCAAIVDCLQPYYFHTHFVGSEGSLLDNKFHSAKLGTNKAQWSQLSMKMLDSGDVSDHPYQSQFQAFFDALEKDQHMPLTSLPEALKSFEVLFASDLSAQQGGRLVKLTELA
jgi:predicted dehydrogenase